MTTHGLRGVQETLLIPLSARVAEHRRRDSPFVDAEAERILTALGADLDHYAAEWTNVQTVVGRTAILDDAVRDWMTSHPGGQVVNLGAGLCTRLWRVDDGRVRWLEVDLPDVVALKRSLVRPHPRHRLHAGSVLDPEWLDVVGPGPVLFVAEGLLMYLTQEEVAALLTTLCQRFPGSTAWLEAIHPFLIRTFGRRSRTVRATGATLQWGLRDGRDLERMAEGVRFVEERYPTEVHPERWGWLRLFRYVGPIHTGLKCVQVRL